MTTEEIELDDNGDPNHGNARVLSDLNDRVQIYCDAIGKSQTCDTYGAMKNSSLTPLTKGLIFRQRVNPCYRDKCI